MIHLRAIAMLGALLVAQVATLTYAVGSIL